MVIGGSQNSGLIVILNVHHSKITKDLESSLSKFTCDKTETFRKLKQSFSL